MATQDEINSFVEQIMPYFEEAAPADDLNQVSFPIPDTGVSQDQWAHMFKGMGSGIISYGQFPYRRSAVNDQTRMMTIHPSTDRETKDSVAVLEGYTHILNNPIDLYVPAVSTRTRYIVALQYDPQREGPGGPIKLDLFAGTLDQTQGKKYVIIYEGWHDPSTVASQIVWTPVRARLAPTITVSQVEHLPNTHHSGLIWGTRCLVTATNEEFVLVHNEAGTAMRWDPIHQPARHLITMYTPYRTVMEQSRTPRVDILNGIAYLHGGFRMANGSAFTAGGDGWHLGSLPAVARPPRQYDLPGVTFSPNPGVVRIRVETSGAIRAFLERSSTAVTLDGLSFPLAWG